MVVKSKKAETVQSDCNHCGKSIRHDILCEATSDGGSEYHCWIRHAVIECRGCGKKSFQYHFKDFENAYPSGDGEWDVPEDVECYPRFEDPTLQIDGIELVPNVVSSIYTETVSAIQEGAYILAGLGLRGTIEAVCNNQSISGRTLEVRIKGLVSKGFISAKDAERLHAIRFLGNDAAHEIKKPEKSQIVVAVKIVKHLIASVYTLQHEADGKLDTLINDYDQYKSLIMTKLSTVAQGDELPLVAILGREIRRIGDARSDLETSLIADITSGGVTFLTIGKMDNYSGSKDALQHYKKL
ncbi:Domain of unknown function DUF4145 [Sphingomonadaceae bacterium]